MNMKKKVFSMLALLVAATTGAWADDDLINLTYDAQTDKWTLASMPAYDVELEIEYYATTPFDLTVGESLHGTVAFSVGGAAATQACYDDEVTVTVNPNEGYSVKDVTVTAITTFESAGARRSEPGIVDEITVTKQQDGTWTFRMPEANVEVTVTYTKNLQNNWIQAIADQTYNNGTAIEPAVVVKDGETTLTEGTDYTVEFTSNTNPGTATVTVTAKEGSAYSGTATATFTILTNKTELNTAITDAETYYNSIKDNASYSEIAATLLAAINTAKGVQSNADATQTEIESATTTLGTALTTAEQNAKGVAKAGLNTAITDAEEYYNSIMDSYPTVAADLLTAINTAKGVQEKTDATQAEIEAALSAIGTAQTVAEEGAMNAAKTGLNNAITAAETYYNSIYDNNPALAAQLLTAINTARGVQDNTSATQADVEDALSAINAAKADTEKAVGDVNDAKNYVDEILSTYPEVAAELQDVIAEVNQVLNNPASTPEQIANALQTLTNAAEAAKADVQVKRVDITIPAKGYVTCYDADKREIKTAVSGVSLYTVTSVSNKQVILSSALTVVDAEKPFLIYNDNDEAKTVSIVVSSNAADNVTVATEFKGTLTAKTFTADDMQAADHYVLNGKNFVWVKNAGTLAAGKCWIELAKSAGASRLSIVFGESTGIAGVSVEGAEHTGWYDLSGRRVAKPAKGVYVKDGKKIVVK